MSNTKENNNYISIKELSNQYIISEATIRNWIKSGYFKVIKNKYIEKESFNTFLKNVVGKEKLTSRANKLYKNNDYNNNINQKIQNILDKGNNNIIDLSEEYEKLLDESYKNKYGVFYTPFYIVRDMMKNIPIDDKTKFLDPCCGTGNFIIHALEKGVRPENIYGYDIDKNAIFILKERVKRMFNVELPNVKNENFLNVALDLSKNNEKFDCIFTNPPWGAKFLKKEKNYYSNVFQTGKSTDTSSLFLSASLMIISENGYLGFLLQEAFFKISSFENIRKKILNKNILRLIDYEKPFVKLQTKAQAVIIKNQECREDQLIFCESKNKKYTRSINSFRSNPKSIINFYTTSNENDVIKHLFSLPHITLKGRCRWAMGIVTGNNKRFCKNQPFPNSIPIYKGSDIQKNKIKEPSIFISLDDFDKLQQVAPIDLYEAKEKVIYRFITQRLCFFYDDKQRYILNSANLFIPFDIPIPVNQLVELLNSDIINWLFQKIFNTHKILREDLECLPLHLDYFKKYDVFSETKYLDFLGIQKLDGDTYRLLQNKK